MNILLTNDDGINAQGIKALAKVLGDTYNVYVVAPETQKSGASHSATYFWVELEVKEYKIEGAKKAYSITGTPADCVYVAIKKLIDEKIDLVISGINQGWNLSKDTFYSGTVGAAREALFLGVPAIASSLGAYNGGNFIKAAEIIKDIIPRYISDPSNKEYILNVNIPDIDSIKGYKVIKAEPTWSYDTEFELVSKDNKQVLQVVKSTDHKELNSKDINGDSSACGNGYVSITPLVLDNTDYININTIKDLYK